MSLLRPNPFQQRLFSILSFLLRILLWPVNVVSQRLFPASDLDGLSPAVTAKAAQHFLTLLKTVANGSTGSISPSTSRTALANSSSSSSLSDIWLTTGFAAAKAEAINNNSLILLYIHSPLHAQSHEFLRRVILSNELTQFLSRHKSVVRAVGFSLHSAQGAHLSHLLQIEAYPFLALLQPRAGSSSSSAPSVLHWMLRASGPALLAWNLEQMMRHLPAAVTRHEVMVADELSRRLHRQEEQELRRQQDEEYQATLRQDQERERQRNTMEALQRQLVEAENQRIRQEQIAKETSIETARALLTPEPKVGTGTSIRFVLPSGTKLNRRFDCDSTIAVLRAYLTLYFHETKSDIQRIGLSTSFPRKTYNETEIDSITLKQAGLSQQSVLMVQDLDA